jgi:hypothetical protein
MTVYASVLSEMKRSFDGDTAGDAYERAQQIAEEDAAGPNFAAVFQSIRVLRTKSFRVFDEAVSRLSWRMTLAVNGLTSHWEHDAMTDNLLLPMRVSLVFAYPKETTEVRIAASGEVFDQHLASTKLPTAVQSFGQRQFLGLAQNGQGQPHVLRASSEHFEYELLVRIARTRAAPSNLPSGEWF